MNQDEFKKLPQGQHVAFCKNRYRVDGVTDEGEPQLVNIVTGETLSAALYGCHLMYLIAAPTPVVEEAPKKRRGRPPKNKD